MCPGFLTSEVLLVLVHTFPLHLHHPPLDAPVADVTEVLHVLLHALRDGVGHHGREAPFALLKVLVVLHLQFQMIVIPASLGGISSRELLNFGFPNPERA